MNEKEVREELSRTLTFDSNNYGKILELSSKLASFDQEFVRFSVDAGVIDRLGSELVAKQETAVSELVKNCYDADATLVTIKFEKTDNLGGVVTIEDNGIGMTREQLVNGFMRISSSSKIHNPYSEIYNRKRAGQKGIGRFAVQRLGENLTITTQTSSDDDALVLSIDWAQYSMDTDLMSIGNSIQVFKKKKHQGTTLRIEGLKDKWSEASIKRIYNYVNDILQPFPLDDFNGKLSDIACELKAGGDKEVKDSTVDPGFKVQFFKDVNGKLLTVADDKLMVYDHATSIFSGFVDENGTAIYSIESDKLNIDEVHELSADPDEENVPFRYLKNIRFRAYYFVFNAGLIPKMQESNIRKLARKQGGIRLYRNGFRVLPYGESDDDWLGLDQSTVRRSILPVHANINFFGFVELKDLENQFNETSSREGLLENDALIELKNFVYRAILSSVIKVAEKRNLKIVSGQSTTDGIYDSIEVRIKNIAFTLDELDKEFERESGQVDVRRKRKKKIQEVKKQIDDLKNAQEQEKKLFLRERSMLRVLSSVGLTIGLFLHEVKDYILNMDNNVSFLIETLNADQVVLSRLALLQANVEAFQTYTSYFDAVISQNVVRNLKPIDIRKTVQRFVDTVENDLSKNAIEMRSPSIKGDYLFTCPMHPSEWSSILFNLFTNAKKAIKRSSNKGIIYIECGKADQKIFVRFSDTGVGIHEEIREKIFDEFFTTSTPSSLDKIEVHNENIGTGLGLKIVRDIIISYRGKIYVEDPIAGFSTSIYIEVPAATNKELDDYGL